MIREQVVAPERRGAHRPVPRLVDVQAFDLIELRARSEAGLQVAQFLRRQRRLSVAFGLKGIVHGFARPGAFGSAGGAPCPSNFIECSVALLLESNGSCVAASSLNV